MALPAISSPDHSTCTTDAGKAMLTLAPLPPRSPRKPDGRHRPKTHGKPPHPSFPRCTDFRPPILKDAIFDLEVSFEYSG